MTPGTGTELEEERTMDAQRFDAVAKAVGRGATRRGALRALVGGAIGWAAGGLAWGGAAADHGCLHTGRACNPDRPGRCCSGVCPRGKKKCRCTEASCPQPTAAESCKEAYCPGRFKCGIRDKQDGTPCEGGGSCRGGACEPLSGPSCTDGVRNGDETDRDCGGSCPSKCGEGQGCDDGDDCESGVCAQGTCRAPSCDPGDGVRNGDETDIDCGGAGLCARCAAGRRCLVGADCESGVCAQGTCQAPSCTDGVQNGDETGVDCGGSCPGSCGDD